MLMLITTKKMIKMRNILYPNVIEKEFHIPITDGNMLTQE